MIKQLLEKWFGLDPIPCATCEVLRDQLDESNRERRELLAKLLDKDRTEPLPSPPDIKEMKPITPQHMPWRVRQQMLEQEDRKKAELMKNRTDELEKELGLVDTSVGEK